MDRETLHDEIKTCLSRALVEDGYSLSDATDSIIESFEHHLKQSPVKNVDWNELYKEWNNGGMAASLYNVHMDGKAIFDWFKQQLTTKPMSNT